MSTTSAWAIPPSHRRPQPPARRPRPLVSAAYRARVAQAEAAAVAEAVKAGGSCPAPLASSPPAQTGPGEGRWEGHPLLGTLIRLGAMAIPVATAVASAVATSRIVSRPSDALAVAGWFALITVVSTLTLVLVDRVARRLLPLAALLKLSMAFPDRAPSRFSVAFKAGTTRNLKERLEEARQHGVHDEPAKNAERVLTLVGALSSHDRGTRGHSERVRAFNDLIAEEMGLPQAERDRLRWAALLHDIGKLHVPKRILGKPGKPTPKEWEQLRRHPEDGARIAAPLAGWLGPWADAIAQHHERWDGGGYPKGLAGNEIGVAGRIVAVADAFETITAPRPYKRPINAHAARAELARCAGSHFDPAVVRAFLNLSIGRLRWAMGPVSWLGQLPLLGSVPRMEGIAVAAGRSAAFAAGTATGVGAMALGGIIGPATAAATVSPSSGETQAVARAVGSAVIGSPTSSETAPASGPVSEAPAQVAPPVAMPNPAEEKSTAADSGRAGGAASSKPRRTSPPPEAPPSQPAEAAQPESPAAAGPDSSITPDDDSEPGKEKGKGKGRGKNKDKDHGNDKDRGRGHGKGS